MRSSSVPSLRPRNFDAVIERNQLYAPRSKPNNQLRQESGSGNNVLASEDNYMRLSVRRSTINAEKELRYRY